MILNITDGHRYGLAFFPTKRRRQHAKGMPLALLLSVAHIALARGVCYYILYYFQFETL